MVFVWLKMTNSLTSFQSCNTEPFLVDDTLQLWWTTYSSINTSWWSKTMALPASFKSNVSAFYMWFGQRWSGPLHGPRLIHARAIGHHLRLFAIPRFFVLQTSDQRLRLLDIVKEKQVEWYNLVLASMSYTTTRSSTASSWLWILSFFRSFYTVTKLGIFR